MSHSDIERAGWEALADAFSTNTTLQHFDLNWSTITSDGWKALARIIRVNKGITTLALVAVRSYTTGDVNEWAGFADALTVNRTITSLSCCLAASCANKMTEFVSGALVFNQTITSFKWQQGGFCCLDPMFKAKIDYFLQLNRTGREKFLNDDLVWLGATSRFTHDLDILFYFLSLRPDTLCRTHPEMLFHFLTVKPDTFKNLTGKKSMDCA